MDHYHPLTSELVIQISSIFAVVGSNLIIMMFANPITLKTIVFVRSYVGNSTSSKEKTPH
jgi:hypothetical protein